MQCCPPINGAPSSLPTAAESYPRGAALASLSKSLPNARMSTEDGRVLNVADLLECICRASSQRLSYLDGTIYTASPTGGISVPAGGEVLIQNQGPTEASVVIAPDTVPMILAPGQTMTISAVGATVIVSADNLKISVWRFSPSV